MVNAFNIRQRPTAVHDGIAPSTSQGIEGSPRDARKKKLKSSSKDTRIALAAAVSFLIIGLFGGYFLMQHQHRRVIAHAFHQRWGNTSMGSAVLGRGAPQRFATVVMPSVVKPSGRTNRLTAITDTWGAKSRALYVVHNASEFPSLSSNMISKESANDADVAHSSYPKLLLMPPNISPKEGVLRLTHVIRTVFEKIDPDFAFFVNDHTYVIPEHLCSYLKDQDPGLPMYVGHALRQDKECFNSGAAGYILSRHSMKSLVEEWDGEDETCLAKKTTSWLQGNPGLVTANCLIHVLKTPAVDSRQNGKFHRFHAYGLVRSAAGKVDKWYINKHKEMDKILGTDASYTKLLSGSDCCSNDTVTFHYVEHAETLALFSIRQKLLLNPSMSDSDLMALMVREWPNDPKELGAYARSLPAVSDIDTWTPVLELIRKISTTETGSECS